MPVTNKAAARDSILTLFKTAWDAQTPPVPAVIYEDRPLDVPEDGSPWAEVLLRHADGRQATLGGTGGRRFRKFGFVVVKIRTALGGGLVQSDALVQVAIDAFEGQKTADGTVWFKNVRDQEIGSVGGWYQVDVLADFEYDSVK